MSGLGEKSGSFRRLNSFFAKVLLIIFCFFCLNFLFTYFSVAKVTVPGAESGNYRGLAIAGFSSWLDTSNFPTFSLLDDFVSSAVAMDGLPDTSDQLSTRASDEETDSSTSVALLDGAVSQQTKVRMFELPDMVLSTQVLGVYRNLCYNGSHILTIGARVACEEEDQVDDGSPGDSPLLPISCDNTKRLELLQGMLYREVALPFKSREEEWFLSRRSSLTWEMGTTSFIYLDRSTANCAHFLGKTNMILLMNGATKPSYPGVVDHFYFILHELREKQWLKTPSNEQGFLATYMAGALNKVLSVFNIPELQSSDVLGNHSIVAAQGRVRIGGHPFMAASEDNPVCFEQAIVPGILKSSHYPPGRTPPDTVRQHFKEWLHVRANETGNSVLLYIRREGRRRVFFNKSEEQLVPIFNNLDGFTLQNISFTGMSFREQFQVSQGADVMISLHGANLVNPTMLSRRNSILFELQPYRVLHRMYETQSFHSGVIYMGHQLDQATPQGKDHLFPGLTYWKCMTNTVCKEYFVHHRNVELTPDDLLQIQMLLAIARRIHFELIRYGITPDSQGLFEPGLVQIMNEDTGAEISCGPFVSTKNELCRNSWVSFADDQGHPRICYVAQRCQLVNFW